MTRNVGDLDRWIRVALGIALLAIVFLVEGPARWIGLVGIVPLVTAAVGYCPIYALFGLTTCRIKAIKSTDS